MFTYLPIAFVFLAVAIVIAFYRGPGRKPLLLVYAAAMFLMAGFQFMAAREEATRRAELDLISSEVAAIQKDIKDGRIVSKDDILARQNRLQVLSDRLTALRR